MEAQTSTDPKIGEIVGLLKHKACTKQAVYRITQDVFKRMKKIAADLANNIDHQIQEIDPSVDVEYINISDFEFQVKFSGDLLVFSMHSNVVAFPKNHVLHSSPYIQEDSKRGFFGAIVAYNFLADSIKYKRMGDPGYLIGRLFMNNESHYLVEGVRQLEFLHPSVQENILGDGILKKFIESAMIAALEIDSQMPSFEQERVISVQQKLSKNMLGNIEKVGFKMTAE